MLYPVKPTMQEQLWRIPRKLTSDYWNHHLLPQHTSVV